jgi:hypothetical protein
MKEGQKYRTTGVINAVWGLEFGGQMVGGL